MHELSLAEALTESVEKWQAANGGKVLSVTVDVGRLGGVDPEALEYAFGLIAPYKIRTVLLPLRFRCGRRRREFEMERLPESCPECGAEYFMLRRLNGRELSIREIEVENV